MARQIVLYDTTLRDGTQGEQVNLSAEDKMRVCRKLDDFGIHYIEGGWPGSNPKDARFFDMARDVIVLSGHEPESEIPITITGLREGEKLHEELLDRNEELVPLPEKKIFLAKPLEDIPHDLDEKIGEMIAHAKRGEVGAVLASMSDLLPSFSGKSAASYRNRGGR